MFAVDNILISDELVDATFSCNLGACNGACCVQGDEGAPLEEGELQSVEEVYQIIKNRMRPEARKAIEEKGVWEEVNPGRFATACIGEAECVFVRYEGKVARCSIQDAHLRGETNFPKPISCHLYPVRVQDMGDYEALNYEQLEICRTAVRRGRRHGILLSDYLEEPLIRKYGARWYARFRDACKERSVIFQEIR